MSSRAEDVIRALAPLGRFAARRRLQEMLAGFSVVELAALAARWEFWARPKQLPPKHDAWRTWGFLTGRGWGKTVSISQFVNNEVYAGRSKLLCLAAQDEASSVAIQVKGPSGLIATAPPWNRPEWWNSEMMLVWPNGARAYVRTPEVPGKIRGLEYDLSWISELQSWPAAQREEAFANVFLSTRIGASRVAWDATPKRRHPLLRSLLEDAARDPERHCVVRGTTHENASNLGAGYVEDLERRYGGTSRGREELLGEMLPDSETALVKQVWIDAHRAPAAGLYSRRCISVDPAITARAGSDTTGIVECALSAGKLYVLRDMTGKHDVGAWADLVLDAYVEGRCDVVVAETNKGGQLVAQNLRAAAARRSLEVRVLGRDDRPFHSARLVNVREVYARGAKEDRAEPLATAYERGMVVHPLGVRLDSLEDTLTSWEPGTKGDSPGDLDALVHAAVELLGLASDRPHAAGGIPGILEAQSELARAHKPLDISRIFGGSQRKI